MFAKLLSVLSTLWLIFCLPESLSAQEKTVPLCPTLFELCLHQSKPLLLAAEEKAELLQLGSQTQPKFSPTPPPTMPLQREPQSKPALLLSSSTASQPLPEGKTSQSKALYYVLTRIEDEWIELESEDYSLGLPLEFLPPTLRREGAVIELRLAEDESLRRLESAQARILRMQKAAEPSLEL